MELNVSSVRTDEATFKPNGHENDKPLAIKLDSLSPSEVSSFPMMENLNSSGD